jgi:hypothetical protein
MSASDQNARTRFYLGRDFSFQMSPETFRGLCMMSNFCTAPRLNPSLPQLVTTEGNGNLIYSLKIHLHTLGSSLIPKRRPCPLFYLNLGHRFSLQHQIQHGFIQKLDYTIPSGGYPHHASRIPSQH